MTKQEAIETGINVWVSKAMLEEKRKSKLKAGFRK